MEEISREELKALKRQAAIRAREEEFEKKRLEEAQQKRDQLQQLKADFEAKEKEKVEQRLAFLTKQAQARSQKKAKTEDLNAKRDAKIQRKQEVWLQKANDEIQTILEAKAEDDERYEFALEAARERKREHELQVQEEREDEKCKWEESEIKRQQAQEERRHARELKGVFKADQLKTEATNELESFILNPYPVPLKQVLAGKLRPVPTVTELLAAYKDQKEDLQELEEQDIPTRALLRNQSVFQYVRDIQMKAEADRIKPPEPQMADLGRSRNRSAASPKNTTNKFRGTTQSSRGFGNR